MNCRHKFVDSNTCLLCGWELPKPFTPATAPAQLRGGGTVVLVSLETVDGQRYHDASPRMLEPGQVTASVWPSTVIVPCPACGELAEHEAERPVLTCPECGAQTETPRWRTANELVAFIRGRLAEDADGSRRRFYNSTAVLFDIAQAVDAFPKGSES